MARDPRSRKTIPPTIPMMAGTVKPPPMPRCSRPLWEAGGTLGITVWVVWARSVGDVDGVEVDEGSRVADVDVDVELAVGVDFMLVDVEVWKGSV